jgi:hypothetical protein
MSELDNHRFVLIRNFTKRRFPSFYPLLQHLPKLDNLYNQPRKIELSAICTVENDAFFNIPCSVSDCFSNEIGFCLHTTLPFFSSIIAGFSTHKRKNASETVLPCCQATRLLLSEAVLLSGSASTKFQYSMPLTTCCKPHLYLNLLPT